MKKLLLTLASAFLFALPAWAAVDINTASQAELEKINGIGPTKAKAIVEYRKQHGAFKSADDLDKVPGFGKKTTDKVKKDITVGNPKAAAAGKAADRKGVKEETDKAITVGSDKAAESGKVAEDKVVKEAKPATEKVEKAAKPEKAPKEKGGKK